MSQNIAAFFEKVQSSPELQQKLEAIEENLLQQKAESIASLSREAGTPFSATDFLAATTEAAKELDETALDAIAGGRMLMMDFLKSSLRSSSSTD